MELVNWVIGSFVALIAGILGFLIPGYDVEVVNRSWPYLFFEGLRFTIMLTILATLGGIALGTVIALMRLSGIAVLSWTANVYTTVLRSLPLVLVIFWFYFLLPYIGAWVWGLERPMKVGAFNSALITFTLFEAAYFAEIMRAGIQSIPKGQAAAGYALGLNYWQVMGNIVLPQAFRNMLPVLLTQTIVLFQDTSLVYVLSLTDFLGAATKVAQRDGRLVEMYLFTAVIYFLISFALSSLVKRLQARVAIVR
jgi:glutamate/aspartate transport system permease protein